MRLRLYVSIDATTDFAKEVRLALPTTESATTRFSVRGIMLQVDGWGPYYETDQLPQDYPAWVDEYSVHRVTAQVTFRTAPSAPGTFCSDAPRVEAVLCSEHHFATGAHHFVLTVSGPTLADVRKMLLAIATGDAEAYRENTWVE